MRGTFEDGEQEDEEREDALSGVVGTLKQMAAPEIVQMLEIGKRSARVDLSDGAWRARLYISKGQILRAVSTDGAQGEAAVVEACRRRSGAFRIHYDDVVEVDANITRSTTLVLLDAMRVIDEDTRAPPPPAAGEGLDFDANVDAAFDGAGALPPDIGDEPPRMATDRAGGVQDHPRYPVSWPVSVVTAGGDVHELALDDISLGGAFITSARPWPEGTSLTLCIDIDGRQQAFPIRVAHVVTTAAAADIGHVPGMGVTFGALGGERAAALRAFVDAAARDEAAAVEQERMPAVGRADTDAARAIASAIGDALDDALDDAFGGAAAAAPREEERQERGAAVGGLELDLPPELTEEEQERLEAILGDVDAAEAATDYATAMRYLQLALQLAPQDEALLARGAALRAKAASAAARQLLDRAQLRGQQQQQPVATTVEMVREAVRLSSERATLARAVELFVMLGARDDAVLAAQYLVTLYPDDRGALHFLFETHVGAGRFAAAAPFGEALMRLEPGDARLRERVAKVASAARRA